MNRLKNLVFGTLSCLVLLGLSDTANGQISTNAPAGGMSFNVQSGGASSTQTLVVTTTGGATTLAVTVPPSGSPWLSVNGNPAGSPTFFPNTGGSPATASLQVTVNTNGFITGQQLTANLSIAILNEPSTAITVPVVLTVGTASALSSSPTTLSFTAISGATYGSPTETPVTISSSGAVLNYNVSSTVTTSANWIGLSSTLGLTTSSSTPGFQVSVNASGLQPGTYTGTITAQSTSTGDSVAIPVTLVVTQGAALTVTGTLANFIYQYNSGQAGFSSQQQSLQISSTSSLNYQVTATNPTGPVPNTNWLVLSQTGGLATTTPQPLYLSLSYQYVANLPVGTYTIEVVIAPTAGAGTPVDETVTLVVSNNGILSVNKTSLVFQEPFGSPTEQTQVLQVTSSNGNPIPYTAISSAAWLSSNPATGGNTSTGSFSVFVNDAGLAVSATPYTGTITLYPNNSDYGNYTVVINVSLTVTGATNTLFAGPGSLLFSYETSQAAPVAQEIDLSSSGTQMSFTVTTTTMNASNCSNSNWLSATPNQNVTPATLTVSVVTSGMTSGFCTGTIILTYNNGQTTNATVTIPVTIDISTSTPLLTVTPDPDFGVVTATYQSTATITASRISVSSTDGSPLGFTATASTPGAPATWLFLGSTSGTTQQYVQVQVQASQLPEGTYNGSITITPTTNSNLPSGGFNIPVVLTVTASTTVSASPTSLTFTQMQAATTAPSSQAITLTAVGGASTFTASVTPLTGGSWLQVSPLSGSVTVGANATITASVPLNTLSVGTYNANINIQYLSSATPTTTIPVTLVITAPPPITVSPTSLSFSYQLGSAAPAAQTLNLTSSSGAVSLTATSSASWLSVSPTSGTTPASAGGSLPLTVTVIPANLTAAQTYTGTITITPSGQKPIAVTVTATVTGTPTPQPTTISNSASGGFGPIAPGELITIKGTNLGPTAPATFTLGSGNTVSSTLSGVQVLFDSSPGTPIYVSSTQINVIVPYEIAGRTSTNVTVSNNNQVSAAIPQTVASQAPGIFTAASSGLGQASILNQNGTINGPSSGLVINNQNIATSPAPEGSVIAVYATGGGQTNPASADGTVTPTGSTLYNIPGTVTATINGVPATVKFAGAAPGLVTGVIQVNILVPTGISGSALPIAITIGGTTSLTGPTVAVQ